MMIEDQVIDDAVVFDEEKGTVVKSNFFINGNYKLSLTQQIILLTVSTQIEMNDRTGKLYEVPISHVLRLLNSKSKNSKHVHEQAQSLMEIVLDLPTQVSQKRYFDYEKVHLINKVAYNGKNGSLYFEIHRDMKPQFLELKDKYTRYLAEYVTPFKGVHSIRIYEMLKEYAQQGYMQREFTQEELKEKLGISKSYMKKGSDGKKTHNFGELKRKVLLVAQRDLEKHADITFDIDTSDTPHRKPIQKFKLKIRPTGRGGKFIATVSGPNADLEDVLIQELAKTYGEELVQHAVKLLEQKKGVKNPVGYLRDGLKKGYFTESFEKVKQEQEKKAQQQAQVKLDFEQSLKEEQVREEYGQFWHNRCLDYFEYYQGHLIEFIEGFQAQYKHDPRTRKVLEDIQKQDFNKQVRLKLGNFIMQQKGQDEEKDFKVYAYKKHGLRFD
jgi:hypothetical protein